MTVNVCIYEYEKNKNQLPLLILLTAASKENAYAITVHTTMHSHIIANSYYNLFNLLGALRQQKCANQLQQYINLIGEKNTSYRFFLVLNLVKHWLIAMQFSSNFNLQREFARSYQTTKLYVLYQMMCAVLSTLVRSKCNFDWPIVDD